MKPTELQSLRKIVLTLNASYLAMHSEISNLEQIVSAVLERLQLQPELLSKRQQIQENRQRLLDSHRQLIDQALRDLDGA